MDCGEKFNARCLVGGGGARSRDRASSCSFVSEFDHALDCWHQDASDCDRSQVPPAPAMGAISRPPCPPLPPANPPCKPPTRLIVRHVFFLCMHDCVCIFACMPRDASIQERAGQHTHQVRLRNDVSMPVADAVPSSWSARTWQALRQKLARSRRRSTSNASAGGAQKLRANPHRGDLRGGEGEGWLTKTS